MESIIASFVLILGLVVGSFLNVVVFRYNTGTGINGRSFCASCGKKLSWYELIPVLSFVILRGKCSFCGSKISWQYPLAETATGLVFFLSYMVYGNDIIHLIFNLIVWSLLAVMFVYDYRHKILPDPFVYAFAAVSFLYGVIEADFFRSGFTPEALNLFAGPALFMPFFLLWYLSDGKWMGLGDGKLVLGIGFMLGFSGGISAVMMGFWLGAVVGLFRMIVSRLSEAKILGVGFAKISAKSEIAFGPFLIIGIFLADFFKINFIWVS